MTLPSTEDAVQDQTGLSKWRRDKLLAIFKGMDSVRGGRRG